MLARGNPKLEVEAKAACAAWLAVLLERMHAGRLPIAGLDDPKVNEDQAAIADRALLYDSSLHTSFEVWHGVMDAEPSAVVDGLLHQVADAVRGQTWEARFWGCVFSVVPTRFPDAIAEDLIERDVNVVHLGHMQLSDRLLWRLSSEVSEALATLAIRRYVDPAYDADAFEEVLHAFPQEEGMFRAVIYCKPSGQDKADRFAQYLDRLESPGQWLSSASQGLLDEWRARQH
jgi:hypothetical protein